MTTASNHIPGSHAVSRLSRLRFPSHGARAFSLIELMAVMAIMSVFAVVAGPSLLGVLGTRATGTTGDVAGFLEQARSYAAANNTYVYVSVSPQMVGTESQLWVTAATSNSGLDLSELGTKEFTLGSTDTSARQLSTTLILKGVELKGKSDVPVTAIARPDFDSSVDLNAPTQAKFGPVHDHTLPVSFWFAPDGSASRSNVLPTSLELSFCPEHKTAAAGAVIQISGLTGTTRVYRAH